MKKIGRLSMAIIGITAILAIYLYSLLDRDLIYKGVKIDQFDVSNMTRDEALNLLKNKKEKDKNKTIKLTYNDSLFKFSLCDFGFEYDYQKTVDKAYRIGRVGNIFTRIIDIVSTSIKGIDIQLETSYDRDKIEHIAEVICQQINVEPRDAEINLKDGSIQIINEVVGKKVKRQELIKAIEGNMLKQDTIQIPVKSIIPKITGDLLSRINGIIGNFSTSFKGSSQNRIENIKLSANAIKGTLLLPGESMSFNETTGPRREEFGYKESNVIIEGEYTPGVGGGVCQTSTTLYNALLLADVTILERYPHSIPPEYIALGKDAAVAYGYLDLKFRNDFDYPIYIDANIVGDRLYFCIYGDLKERDFAVKVESEIVEVIEPKEETIFDEGLEAGNRIIISKGRRGYKVNTYKYIIKNGQFISKELISQDYYRPQNYVYKVGGAQGESKK